MSDPAEARAAALRLLARREHARAELAAKLRRAGFDAEVLAGVLTALEAEGALSDERFCEVYVRSRVDSGHGPLRIRMELDQRGAAAAAADAALAAAETDWVGCAAEVRRKRFGAGLPRDFREWSRQARFLQYRGFSTEQIRTVLGDEE